MSGTSLLRPEAATVPCNQRPQDYESDAPHSLPKNTLNACDQRPQGFLNHVSRLTAEDGHTMAIGLCAAVRQCSMMT